MDKLRDAIRAYYQGAISQTELYQIFWDTKHAIGIPPGMIWTQFDQMLRTQGSSEGIDLAMENFQDVPPPPGRQQGPINIATNYGERTEDIDLQAAFRRGLGQAGLATGLGSGVFGEYLRTRGQPTIDVYGAQLALSGQQQEDNPFQAYAQQTRGNVGKQALGAFIDFENRLRGGGLDPTSEGYSRMQPWMAPSTSKEEERVARLAREAARGKYGSVFANQFLPSSERMLEDWQAGPTGAQSTDLLPYLRRALGL